MADKLTPERRSENMRRIKAKHSKPEMAVRRMLHRAGYRYRLHSRDLPGKPDIVFAGRRKAIFVHGCFWHQHELEACLDGRKPKSNTAYWHAKLARNVERDRTSAARLEANGWDVLTVWECELADQVLLMKRLQAFLGVAAPIA